MSKLSNKKWFRALFRRRIFIALLLIAQVVFLYFLIESGSRLSGEISVILTLISFFAVLYIIRKRDKGAYKLMWVILILTVPIFGGLFYLMTQTQTSHPNFKASGELGQKKAERLLFAEDCGYKAAVTALPEHAPQIRYLSDFAKFPIYTGSGTKYLSPGEEMFTALLAELEKAEHYIFLEYFIIQEGEMWNAILAILKRKAAAGVTVRVMYDDFGCFFLLPGDYPAQLKKFGIECVVFNPFRPLLTVVQNNRDHRKITVIDGQVAYTGGYNLANEYFNITHPYGIWKDTGIRMEGDAVKSMTVAFLEMWNAVSDKDQNDADFTKFLPDYPYAAKQTGFIQPYADSPIDHEHVGEEVYISMANKAEKYCWFMTPYLIITDEMSHALCLAAKRGVDVRIITPGIPDKKMIYNITRSFYHGLVKHGVRIYEWTPGFCHAKMSVADDCMATCGTINLDYRSLYHHFENGCFMADCQAVLDIRNDLAATMDECREVTEQYSTGRSAYLRLGQLFMRLFAGLL